MPSTVTLRTAILSACLAIAGCANVPQEVVDLSNTVGENMSVVHESHRTLIRQHFANIRQQRLDWVDAVWAPRFIEKFIADGRLIEIANGRLVYDPEMGAFVPPTVGREKLQLLNSVQAWSEEAIIQLEKKRKELIAPVDKDERELLAAVDEAFARLFRGNAVITAHLNSLRNVQGTQDDVLKALKLDDLRVKINEGLAKASEKAALSADEIKGLENALGGARLKLDAAKRRLNPK